jgi:gluconolactonase
MTIVSVPTPLSAEELFVAKPLTAQHSFTPEIEGPACDRAGNIYAVSFARKPTIGRITPDGAGEVFIEFTGGSLGNGIRFDRSGIMYVADYTRHNILRIDPKSRAVTVLAHSDEMNQPNDLAITAEGMLFASDPNWGNGTGQIWRAEGGSRLTRIARNMGTTNGIEVSPDGKKLYVNETVQRKVWAFTLHPDGSISDKSLLIEFPDFGLDGMRCDVEGNLYIARFGKGTVVKVSPRGEVLREVDVLGANPTNVCFGGPDGRICYVTESQKGRLLQFRVDHAGLEWQRQHERP